MKDEEKKSTKLTYIFPSFSLFYVHHRCRHLVPWLLSQVKTHARTHHTSTPAHTHVINLSLSPISQSKMCMLIRFLYQCVDTHFGLFLVERHACRCSLSRLGCFHSARICKTGVGLHSPHVGSGKDTHIHITSTA